MPDLLDTFKEIKKDPQKMKDFVDNPETVLRGRGHDPDKLRINRYRLPTGQGSLARPTICASIGFIVCVSVGD